MLIYLTDFLDDKDDLLPFEGEMEIENHDFGTSISISKAIRYEGEIFKLDGDKLINLRIAYVYEGNCDRCLKPILNEVKTRFTARLLEKKYREKEDSDGTVEVIYFENDVINIEEHLVNQVILSLPMKSLCKSDCRGLCPKCGVDLNTASCDCNLDDVDPRLEKLQNFFLKN
ncbi:MAG: DUF177 domain-containing protein [Tissierellaceae bacterium]